MSSEAKLSVGDIYNDGYAEGFRAGLTRAAEITRGHLVFQGVGTNAWVDVHNICTAIEVERDREGTE